MAPWSSSSSSSLSVYQHKARVCTRKVRKEGIPRDSEARQSKGWKISERRIISRTKRSQTALPSGLTGGVTPLLFLALSGNFFFLLSLRERQKSTGYQEGAADLRASFCASFSSKCVLSVCASMIRVCVCVSICVFASSPNVSPLPCTINNYQATGRHPHTLPVALTK